MNEINFPKISNKKNLFWYSMIFLLLIAKGSEKWTFIYKIWNRLGSKLIEIDFPKKVAKKKKIFRKCLI